MVMLPSPEEEGCCIGYGDNCPAEFDCPSAPPDRKKAKAVKLPWMIRYTPIELPVFFKELVESKEGNYWSESSVVGHKLINQVFTQREVDCIMVLTVGWDKGWW
jgi:hypothetical protein